MIIHVDYVWVDGLASPKIRSKTKIENVAIDEDGSFDLRLAAWNFDGSSTKQATTEDSERILTPQRVYKISDTHYAVLCEVDLPTLNGDGDPIPHESNYRRRLINKISELGDTELWIGFEQEYFITKNGKNVLSNGCDHYYHTN